MAGDEYSLHTLSIEAVIVVESSLLIPLSGSILVVEQCSSPWIPWKSMNTNDISMEWYHLYLWNFAHATGVVVS